MNFPSLKFWVVLCDINLICYLSVLFQDSKAPTSERTLELEIKLGDSVKVLKDLMAKVRKLFESQIILSYNALYLDCFLRF